MPAGSWGQFGEPWSVIDPGREANCGREFTKVLGAWNGVLWDGRYVWQWAGGGHGDGCNNGLMRYDLATGRPEWVVPHMALNVPLCRIYVDGNGRRDCFNEPYVSARPWPAGMDLTKEEKLAKGPVIDDVFAIEEKFGAFLRPRSSHMYNNMVRIGDWVYLIVGDIWGSGKTDFQVWRYNAAVQDIAASIERVADNYDPRAAGGRGDVIVGGRGNANWVEPPGRMPFALTGSGRCTPIDLEKGRWHCESYPGMTTNGTRAALWDATRNGVWLLRPRVRQLAFYAENGLGQLIENPSLSVTSPELSDAGGLCLVPTDAGADPVMLQSDGDLVRWNGTELDIVSLPGAPKTESRRTYNKWIWDNAVGACLGTFTTNEAIWIYKPDVSSGQ
ncbi:MAG: hypothetical protein Tsb0032_33330 [Kiloniellaceae bacterium]